MKKTIVIALAFLVSAFVYAQDAKKTEIKASELPKGVSGWVEKNIPGGKITRAGKIDDKGTITYAALVEAGGRTHSYLFDKDGKFVGKGDQGAKASGVKAAPPATTPTQKGAPATTTTPAKAPTTTKTTSSAPKPSATEEAAPKK